MEGRGRGKGREIAPLLWGIYVPEIMLRHTEW